MTSRASVVAAATGILARYLVGGFLRIFLLALSAFVAIYVIADFFDRLDDFLKYGATAGAMIRYFAFKVPLIVTQVTPVAALAALLLSLGNLSRHNEVTAMSACGVSLAQIAVPLLGTCFLMSLGSFVWNEAVVPHFNRKVRYVNTVEIKKREIPSLFGSTELWSHGESSFYNVRALDVRSQRLMGLTLYRIDGEFRLQEVLEVPVAEWRDDAWRFSEGVQRRFDERGDIETVKLSDGVLKLRETPADLATARREAEELSYFALSELIGDLQRKGLDPTEYVVDLHLKLSVPFIPMVMAMLAIPLGVRNLRTSSLASNVGTGLLIGFSYWVVLAFSVPLGHSGALPPFVAAWAANLVFAGVGAFLVLASP